MIRHGPFDQPAASYCLYLFAERFGRGTPPRPRLIQRLSGGEFGGRRLRLVPLLWEDEVPAITGDPAQLAVDYYMGRAAETDIYVGIFWTRIGSPAVIGDRRHESGTLYEFQQGYASFKTDGAAEDAFVSVRPADPAGRG